MQSHLTIHPQNQKGKKQIQTVNFHNRHAQKKHKYLFPEQMVIYLP